MGIKTCYSKKWTTTIYGIFFKYRWTSQNGLVRQQAYHQTHEQHPKWILMILREKSSTKKLENYGEMNVKGNTNFLTSFLLTICCI